MWKALDSDQATCPHCNGYLIYDLYEYQRVCRDCGRCYNLSIAEDVYASYANPRTCPLPVARSCYRPEYYLAERLHCFHHQGGSITPDVVRDVRKVLVDTGLYECMPNPWDAHSAITAVLRSVKHLNKNSIKKHWSLIRSRVTDEPLGPEPYALLPADFDESLIDFYRHALQLFGRGGSKYFSAKRKNAPSLIFMVAKYILMRCGPDVYIKLAPWWPPPRTPHTQTCCAQFWAFLVEHMNILDVPIPEEVFANVRKQRGVLREFLGITRTYCLSAKGSRAISPSSRTEPASAVKRERSAP